MNPNPPFVPPYFTTSDGEAGRQIIETLADGSTRAVPASERTAMSLSSLAELSASSSATVSSAAKARSGIPRAAAGKDAAVVLEVPYADKDKAKKAGARWDATRKKWYVPHGTDIQLFKAWWPAGMKD